MKLRLLLSAIAAVAALGMSAISNAVSIDPPSLSINGWAPSLTALGCTADAAGIETCAGGGLSQVKLGSPFTLTEWDLTLDPDPSVFGFIAIQNNLTVAQTFTFVFLVPVASQGPSVQVSGSISGSLTEGTAIPDSASLTSVAPSMYQAQIDGLTVQTLLNHSQSFSTTTSTTWGPASFGPTTLGQAANTSIAIRVDFTLSPGDLASFTSRFNVIAVPEPATLAMLGGGLVGLVAFGRRYPRS
jgi:hypothetical protein